MIMDELRQFLAVVDNFLANETKRIFNNPPPIEDEEAYLFSGPFQNILYSSIIISTVSFLEREIKGFAELLKYSTNNDLSINDIKGSWIKRFRKYSEKVIRLKLGIKDALWQDINGIIEVRNCLVHAGGIFTAFKGRKEVEKLCKRYKLTCMKSDLLEPDYNIAQTVQKIIGKFLEGICAGALTMFPYK